jgi:hypothetical protein
MLFALPDSKSVHKAFPEKAKADIKGKAKILKDDSNSVFVIILFPFGWLHIIFTVCELFAHIHYFSLKICRPSQEQGQVCASPSQRLCADSQFFGRKV